MGNERRLPDLSTLSLYNHVVCYFVQINIDEDFLEQCMNVFVNECPESLTFRRCIHQGADDNVYVTKLVESFTIP